MTKRGRVRLSGRSRTIAALAIVGAFYGTAAFALTSTDAAPVATPTASSAPTQNVVLVGATRTGLQGSPAASGLQDLCRYLPGFPFCTARTVTTTVTQPGNTVTTTINGPTSTVTTRLTDTATSTVTKTVTTYVTNTVTSTKTNTVTDYKTVTNPNAVTVTKTVTDYKTVTR